jgi:hypothetical protein
MISLGNHDLNSKEANSQPDTTSIIHCDAIHSTPILHLSAIPSHDPLRRFRRTISPSRLTCAAAPEYSVGDLDARLRSKLQASSYTHCLKEHRPCCGPPGRVRLRETFAPNIRPGQMRTLVQPPPASWRTPSAWFTGYNSLCPPVEWLDGIQGYARAKGRAFLTILTFANNLAGQPLCIVRCRCFYSRGRRDRLQRLHWRP